MGTAISKLIERLDSADKKKLEYFLRILLKQSKYKSLRKEISMRRREIASGESLDHSSLWDKFDV